MPVRRGQRKLDNCSVVQDKFEALIDTALSLKPEENATDPEAIVEYLGISKIFPL